MAAKFGLTMHRLEVDMINRKKTTITCTDKNQLIFYECDFIQFLNLDLRT